jgi:hypothetical protein
MAGDLGKYSVKQVSNASIGQGGCVFEDGTTAVTGNFVAIQFLEDSTFTTLTPRTSDFIGTASGSGDAIDSSNTFPQGVTVFGDWTAFALASGSVIAYIA